MAVKTPQDKELNIPEGYICTGQTRKRWAAKSVTMVKNEKQESGEQKKKREKKGDTK